VDFFDKLTGALVDHPTSAILAIILIAFGWFVRDSRRRDEAREAQIADLYAKHAAAMQAAHTEHLQTAMQILPTARDLVKCLELFERLMPRAAP
jgi:hypothetical protein